MVLPFDRQPLLHKRYAYLALPAGLDAPKESKEPSPGGEEYANFLRSLANGQRQDNAISRPAAVKASGTSKASSQTQTGISFGKEPGSTKGSPRPSSPNRTDGLVHVTLRAQQNEKDHQKRMKVIEDHMLQHKQEERELKRSEGDIIKKQHQLRRLMHNYENNVYKKRREEEGKLVEANQEAEKVKQQHSVQQDKGTKSRTERNASASLKMKDRERKALLNGNSLEFQYHRVAKQLELTRAEVGRLTQDFESKLKKKEEEELKLEKKLADLAIDVNMEAQKKRTLKVDDQRHKRDVAKKDIEDGRRRQTSLDDKLRGMAGQNIRHEYNKRRLSRDLTTTKGSLSLKAREEGRKMTDINRRLQHNSVSQKEAKQAAEYLELDRQGKEIEERGQFAEARRNHMLEQSSREKRQQYVQQMSEWKTRVLDKQNEVSRKSHEDGLKHLQKSVSKLEETEHALYNRVRAADMQRRKQEQSVQRMLCDLVTLRRDNARKLKDATVQCQKREVELEQKVLREQAELAKLHSHREESIQTLVMQRQRLRRDKHMLSEEEREHDRLARIGQKTDSLQQQVL